MIKIVHQTVLFSVCDVTLLLILVFQTSFVTKIYSYYQMYNFVFNTVFAKKLDNLR
jgi:hypothetical protein